MNGRVKRIVQEGTTQDDLLVSGGDQRKPLRDGPESGCGRNVSDGSPVVLGSRYSDCQAVESTGELRCLTDRGGAGEVGGMHDLAQLTQGWVGWKVLVDQRLE